MLFFCMSMSVSVNADLIPRYGAKPANKTAYISLLKQTLLQGYDRKTTPPGALVQLQLSLWHIISLSTQNQDLTFHGWWRLYWRDTRLAWDKESNNISSLTMFADEVWMPEVLVYEMQGQDSVSDTSSISVKINSDGEVATSIARTTHVTCQIDIAAFPVDKQNCIFTIGSQVRCCQAIPSRQPMLRAYFTSHPSWHILHTSCNIACASCNITHLLQYRTRFP